MFYPQGPQGCGIAFSLAHREMRVRLLTTQIRNMCFTCKVVPCVCMCVCVFAGMTNVPIPLECAVYELYLGSMEMCIGLAATRVGKHTDAYSSA